MPPSSLCHGVRSKLAPLRKARCLSTLQRGAVIKDAQQRLKKRTLQIGDFGKQQHWEMALGVMHQMQRELLQPSIFTYSALVTACSRGSQWEPPLQLLSQMRRETVHPDAHFIGALISACAVGQAWQSSLGLFHTLQEYRLQPNVVTYNATMSACSKGQLWKTVIQLFNDLVKQDGQPDQMSFSIGITANGNASFWPRSLELFGQMQRKMRADLVSFSSVIHASGMGSAWQMSLKFLSNLRVHDLRPNVATYGACIGACDRGSQWPEVLVLLKHMERDQCHPNSVNLGSALVTLQRNLQWQKAIDLMRYYGLERPKDFDRSRSRQSDLVEQKEEMCRETSSGEKSKVLKAKLMNYTAAIKARVDMSDWAGGLAYFQELRRSAVSPDERVYSLAVQASGLGTQWEMAVAVCHEMLRQSVAVNTASLIAATDACKERGQLFVLTELLRSTQIVLQQDGKSVLVAGRNGGK